MIKLKFRGVTIPYCARKKRITLESEKKIEKDIDNLEAKLNPNTIDNIDLLENILSTEG